MLCEKLDVPFELLNDDIKLTLHGSGRVILERHKGIAVYREDEIVISYSKGVVRLKGKDMTIKNYGKDDIIIDGKILSVDFGDV